MKTFFWTTISWIIIFFGFLGYLKWFDQDLGCRLTSYIATYDCKVAEECPCDALCEDRYFDWEDYDYDEDVNDSQENQDEINNENESAKDEWKQENMETKIDEIYRQVIEINEKLDIQNSNAPDAISVSLRTNKKTNIWIFPLDGSSHKQYVLAASDDILRDTLNLLFDKSAFQLKSTKLDNDWNLTINLERDFDVAFGWSAMVQQVKTSIEKTATQFSQVKKVKILPEDVIQP